jgi:hypothetical protein
MDLNHLSEEQIQEYLDRREPEGLKEMDAHLQICPLCHRIVQQYRKVYSQISQEAFPGLSKDFSAKVITRIKTELEPENHFWENIFFVAFLATCLVGISFLTNPLPLLKSMFQPLFGLFIHATGKLPVQLNGIWVMITASAFILLFYEILNIKILKPKS